MSAVFPDPTTELMYHAYEVACREIGVSPFSRGGIKDIIGDITDTTTASYDIAYQHDERDGFGRISSGHVRTLAGFIISDNRRAKFADEWKAAIIEALIADPHGYQTADSLFAKAMNGGRLLDAYSAMEPTEARRIVAETVAKACKAIDDLENRLWFDGMYMGPTDPIKRDRIRAEAVREALAPSPVPDPELDGEASSAMSP